MFASERENPNRCGFESANKTTTKNPLAELEDISW